MLSSERLDNVLLFHRMDDRLSKSERRGPKGNEAFRYIASAEIIDLENEIINLDAIAEVMPIMKEQGARTSVDHMNFPAGEFFDWGFTTVDGIPAIWLDLEVYEKYPNQKKVLRRIKLSSEDPESLNALSLGGFKLEKHRECGDLTCWTRITKIEGWEFSHVHKGANQLSLKIEEQLDHMEFESLNKEQPRDSSGQFVSEITTTTVTKYSESTINKKSPCDKKLEKGNKDKEYKEDKNLEEEQELEEEVVEQAEEEQASEDLAGEEELNEEPMGDELMEEGLEDPMDQIADRELLVDTNERVKVIMSAMNIDKSDTVAIDKIISSVAELDEHLKKNQGEKEMTDNEITVNGVTYVLKPDTEKPEIGKSDPEKTETYTKDEVDTLVESSVKTALKEFSEEITKANSEEEQEVTDNTQNPAEHDEQQAPEEVGAFNKSMSVEDRLMKISSFRKGDPLTVFEA